MLYGIEAAEIDAPGPLGTWTAVTFNSARLVLSSISCTDNGYFSFAGWFNSDWDVNGNYGGIGFIVDPENTYASSLIGKSDNSVTFRTAGGADEIGAIIAAPPVVSNSWQHIIGTVQTTPSRIVKIYVNDTDASASLSIFGSTYTPIISNGLPLWVGSDYAGDDFYSGDMADLSIWPGVSFLTAGDISETTRRYFIDGSGNRVAPSVAVAALGAPAVMLTGGPSTFLSNSLGTSGALTLAEGSLGGTYAPP